MRVQRNEVFGVGHLKSLVIALGVIIAMLFTTNACAQDAPPDGVHYVGNVFLWTVDVMHLTSTKRVEHVMLPAKPSWSGFRIWDHKGNFQEARMLTYYKDKQICARVGTKVIYGMPDLDFQHMPCSGYFEYARVLNAEIGTDYSTGVVPLDSVLK